jgi:hypothetical protein
MKFSPIIIFSYNRPNHLKNLISSLLLNKNIKKHKIFFFCDGDKNLYDKKKIIAIKKIMYSCNKKLNIKKILFRKKNIGLAKSVVYGVSEVLRLYPSCIVLEDDLVVNPNTIKFMNYYLNHFKNNNKIGSVSAYSYINNMTKLYKKDYYLTYRHCSWCWGTWSRVWTNISWNSINYKVHFSNKTYKKKFSRGGKDLNLLLWGQYKNYIDSWAIRFNYFCFKKNLLSFQPRYSMIYNDGKDFSGTHEGFSLNINKVKINFSPKLLKIKNYLELYSKEIELFIKNSHRKSLRLLIKHFYKEGYFL